MKNSLVTTSLLSISTALIVGLTGCGGSSDSNGSDASEAQAITAYDFEIFQNGITMKRGADGDLTYADGNLNFVNGISSMTVASFSETVAVDYTDTNGARTKGTAIINAIS